jgi:FtsZ-interacting cell division protein ZipA
VEHLAVSTTAQPEPAEAAPRKHRNRWIWVSVVLAVIAAGLLVWALTLKSDLDSAQQDLDKTKSELASTNQKLESTAEDLDNTNQKLDSTSAELQTTTQEAQSSGSSDDKSKAGRAVLAVGALAGVKALYDDLSEQLGTTQEDLEKTQQSLEDANKQADQAAQDAAAAKEKAAQADNETEKAQAEADQAKAEAKAAEAKNQIAADCARAYVSAFGTLFEGDDVSDQAAAVRAKFADITADCQNALAEK